MADAKNGQGDPGTSGQGDPGNVGAGGEKPAFATFDEYIATVPAPIKNLFEQHTVGLESALDKERANAKEYAKQLRDAAKTADAGTAAKLNALASEKDTEVEQARAEIAFTREAVAAGCNRELLADAWTLAQKDGLTDVTKLKIAKPWLFDEPKKSDAKAGAGSNGSAGTKTEHEIMNQKLRASLGRGTVQL